MIHRESHPVYVEGCKPCKWSTLSLHSVSLSQERRGEGLTGGMTNREYVHKMYADRRREGLPDPEPENAKAAVNVPKEGKYL